MEHYPLLKMLHMLPGILLLVGVPVHLFMLWKASRSGDSAVLQRKLKRTRLISLPVLGLLALSLPVTGWLLVDLIGWPLSQTWLLFSSVLFAVLMLIGLLLAGRLGAWQALNGAPAPKRLLGFCATYAGLIMLLLLIIMGLMGAKPA
ncbi:MAG: DUF2269 domain-containing protein [Gammaproteobacteria bacterium HGW-Gammaproteobacteria-13]|uniref:DUF2269 family protein n=1 Tax=Pseudomonas sp. 1928-m TaxID=3033804 RepID=UPI000CCAB518|nr:DUF2269 family protein [Pseudomonas sp. 1928-m]MDF3193543.1 DUF2269 family protein [Pseudomonas sp. 1928-m]PKM27251.1 MAG: DUF2269 domain-containing protein [Gammaproteobacteria bacterium HGW-Gammaproteobacteria-13]